MSEKETTILAFDTCFQACSVAVIQSGTTIHSCYEEMDTGHVERLIPMISEVLTEADIAMKEVEGVAVTIGPGTFTGTRIGIATARSFALSLNCPTYGVPTLTPMFRKAHKILGHDNTITPDVVAINARRHQLYVQFISDPRSLGQSEPELLSPIDAAKRLNGNAALAVGSGAPILAEAAEKSGASCQVALEGLQPDAAFIELKDLRRYTQLRPLYLRPPDAKPPAQTSIVRAKS